MEVKKICFYTLGASDALTHARNCLLSWGYDIADAPCPAVTHLLLPVPSFEPGGNIKGGPNLAEVLPRFSPDVTVLGGMLPPLPVATVDLLQDAHYTAENAAITAHCALGLLMQQLPTTLANLPVLILGWGRIGKCLGQLLSGMGTRVTVAARRVEDRAMIAALRMEAVDFPVPQADRYAVVINTIPAPVLQAGETRPGAYLLDLASQPGILGENVHWERGLPGRLAPQSAGTLMAKTALRYALGKE